jgi:hypothetical protein
MLGQMGYTYTILQKFVEGKEHFGYVFGRDGNNEMDVN